MSLIFFFCLQGHFWATFFSSQFATLPPAEERVVFWAVAAGLGALLYLAGEELTSLRWGQAC